MAILVGDVGGKPVVARNTSTKNVLKTSVNSSSAKNATDSSGNKVNNQSFYMTPSTTTTTPYVAPKSTGDDDDTTTSADDYLANYYQALLDRYNEATAKRDAYNNQLYNDWNNDINGRYSRLKRQLQRKAVNNGQDQYVTNAWNIDYAKDNSLNSLNKAKLEAEATNSENDYSNYNSIYNSLLNSSASDSLKKKFFNNYK